MKTLIDKFWGQTRYWWVGQRVGMVACRRCDRYLHRFPTCAECGPFRNGISIFYRVYFPLLGHQRRMQRCHTKRTSILVALSDQRYPSDAHRIFLY